MRDAASALRGPAELTIIDGEAYALPLHDQSVDGLVSLQVFEYLDDVPC